MGFNRNMNFESLGCVLVTGKELNMENEILYHRYVLSFYYLEGKNAHQASENLRKVYGDNAIHIPQCQRWFMNFCPDDFYRMPYLSQGRQLLLMTTRRH